MNDYTERLEYNRGYSKCTVRNYLTGLKLFDKYTRDVFFYGVEECERIKAWHIDGFAKEERMIHGKDEKTVNNYLAGIKLYLRYCMIMGKDVENYQKVLFAKEHRIKIESLSEDNVVKLINYFKNVKCDTELSELIKIRNLIIVRLLVYTGMRVNELSSLKIKDIGEDMQIIGKGGKKRYISIHEDELRLIDLYLLLRKDNSEWLLVSHSKNSGGNRLSNVSIEKIIRNGGKKAGIDEVVFPHKLRHTFATQLLKHNANIYHISQLLGHSSIQTTVNYLSVLNCEIKATQNLIPRY